MGSNNETKRWLSQVDELGLAAGNAAAHEQDAFIFAMGQLLRLCPGRFRQGALSAGQEQAIFGYLRLGAYADAALALLPERAGVMTSNSGRVLFCASVRLEGQEHEATATASTFALALVSALALSFVEAYLGLATA
ncbi:hypothetical protein MTR62_15015 [Novosphingobium sp. 1949]|uniref:Uncharacterized protein n=1 Tax=Novosphingobium organovorum TaxID=2930092 RepID=A0ABT0BG24_9SPHN|nr:hypothetical protein [Novosphingobium organovorum]MCJ2183994.1 hypothetical protein [Novosphingobium organovorum]